MGQAYFQYLDTPTGSVYAVVTQHHAQEMPRYSPTQEACARVLSCGHGSAAAVNPLHCDTQVCTPTSAQAQGFKDSPTCCATQALGLQLVPLCTEEV